MGRVRRLPAAARFYRRNAWTLSRSWSWNRSRANRTARTCGKLAARDCIQYSNFTLLSGKHAVWGTAVDTFRIGIPGAGHPHMDRRRLEMAKLVVAKIDAQPDVITIAHNHDRAQESRALEGAPGCNAATVPAGVERVAGEAMGGSAGDPAG